MSQPDPESGFLAVLPRVKSATVLIGLPPEQLDDHAAGMGTGFFAVETGLVLTSNHVVESHVNMKMTQWLRVWLPARPKPRPYPVAGHLSDPLHDLCLLWVDDDGRLPAPLSASPVVLDLGAVRLKPRPFFSRASSGYSNMKRRWQT
jgi:S1-C subfamily serine protease